MNSRIVINLNMASGKGVAVFEIYRAFTILGVTILDAQVVSGLESSRFKAIIERALNSSEMGYLQSAIGIREEGEIMQYVCGANDYANTN